MTFDDWFPLLATTLPIVTLVTVVIWRFCASGAKTNSAKQDNLPKGQFGTQVTSKKAQEKLPSKSTVRFDELSFVKKDEVGNGYL